MGKVKYAAWEVGPTWDMVEQWIESYQDIWKRKLTITMGFNAFRNGATGLFLEASSWSGGGRHAPEHFYATLYYWPNSRFVSLPATVIGLITEHEKGTREMSDKWARGIEALPLEELPLFEHLKIS